jgi:hypothetical protein
VCLSAVLVIALGAAAEAQPSPKIAHAVRVTRAPRIDGKLDDAGWAAVSVLSDFVQRQPNESQRPSERTEVLLGYDDEALYVGAHMYRADPSAMQRAVTRRDGAGTAERFTITLDPQLDRRTGVGFSVSVAGVRSDYRHTRDADGEGRESQFDPVWSAAAHEDATGWTAEMRIPFSQLRFPRVAKQRWGVQFDRWMPDKNEVDLWALILPRETGFISRFGTLEGIDDITPTRPVEFVPYLAGDLTRRATSTVANPLVRPLAGRAGLDAKMAVGPNLTLDATFNPDFGQVEADPAEVNLTAFETFFEERRPFFTEGSEMVRGPSAGYFYPRRIGAPPHGTASGDFVNVPRASTILSAAKLTGRLPSRLSIGAVAALTGDEHARVLRLDSSLTRNVPVEPRAAFGVLRLQQEIGTQASTIGTSFTTVQRNFSSAPALGGLLARESYYGGADWRLRFKQGMYAITGFVAGTHVAGDTAAIRRLQMANTHLFQRPDRRDTIFDPRKTAISGYSAQLRFDKDAGRHTLAGAEVKLESPGFELNDLGRLGSADDIEYNADLQIRETVPGRYVRNWRLGFDTRGAFNYEGAHQVNAWGQAINVTFLNFWSANVRTQLDLPTIDDALTRGGPYMGTPKRWRQEYRLTSQPGTRFNWRVSGALTTDEYHTWRREAAVQLTVRPSPRVSLAAEPSLFAGTDPRQYVTTLSGGRVFNARYVFAYTDRRTISTKLRANYAFSPNLSLEGYAEPFVASGRYSRFGELLAPRSRLLREYGSDGTSAVVDSAGVLRVTDGTASFAISNRDFHVLSFRSNLVMRWEWLPGSTFFVVWQQNRRTADAFGDPARVRELLRTTRADGDNVLAMKMTYWLPVRVGR